MLRDRGRSVVVRHAGSDRGIPAVLCISVHGVSIDGRACLAASLDVLTALGTVCIDSRVRVSAICANLARFAWVRIVDRVRSLPLVRSGSHTTTSFSSIAVRSCTGDHGQVSTINSEAREPEASPHAKARMLTCLAARFHESSTPDRHPAPQVFHLRWWCALVGFLEQEKSKLTTESSALLWIFFD